MPYYAKFFFCSTVRIVAFAQISQTQSILVKFGKLLMDVQNAWQLLEIGGIYFQVFQPEISLIDQLNLQNQENMRSKNLEHNLIS